MALIITAVYTLEKEAKPALKHSSLGFIETVHQWKKKISLHLTYDTNT